MFGVKRRTNLFIHVGANDIRPLFTRILTKWRFERESEIEKE